MERGKRVGAGGIVCRWSKGYTLPGIRQISIGCNVQNDY